MLGLPEVSQRFWIVRSIPFPASSLGAAESFSRSWSIRASRSALLILSKAEDGASAAAAADTVAKPDTATASAMTRQAMMANLILMDEPVGPFLSVQILPHTTFKARDEIWPENGGRRAEARLRFARQHAADNLKARHRGQRIALRRAQKRAHDFPIGANRLAIENRITLRPLGIARPFGQFFDALFEHALHEAPRENPAHEAAHLRHLLELRAAFEINSDVGNAC